MNQHFKANLLALALAGFAALLLASCGQPAGPTPTTPTPDPGRAARYTAYFNEADVSGDGVVDQAEIGVIANADFDNMDYNNDGVVTIEDVYNDAQGEPEGAERDLDFASDLPYDTNDDNQITPEEYRAHLDAKIQDADLDGNGQIMLAEYQAYEEF